MMGTFILLLEDDEDHAQLMRYAFESSDGDVVLKVANNLCEARAVIEERTPDLVITDMHLPDGMGVELLSSNEMESSFPVVILSSQLNENLATLVFKKGACEYLEKSADTFAKMPVIAKRVIGQWAKYKESGRRVGRQTE